MTESQNAQRKKNIVGLEKRALNDNDASDDARRFEAKSIDKFERSSSTAGNHVARRELDLAEPARKLLLPRADLAFV